MSTEESQEAKTMDLSDIVNEDEFGRHMISTPDISHLLSPKSNNDEDECSSHHSAIPSLRQSRQSATPYSQTLRGQIESMAPEELRNTLLERTQELRKLRAEIQSRNEENFQLRHQLISHLNPVRSRSGRIRSSSFCQYPTTSMSLAGYSCRTSGRGHSSMQEYNRSVVTEAGDGEEELLLSGISGAVEQPSRISVFISQSMTVLAQINNEEVIEKVCAGSVIAKKVLLGSIVGYSSSHLLKKFGKFAATSIFGSFILIKMAHHRGYIAVDWNRIQKQIESKSNMPNNSNDNSAASDVEDVAEDELAWLSHKVHQIRAWSRENTYSVLGFWGGFLLHNLHS